MEKEFAKELAELRAEDEAAAAALATTSGDAPDAATEGGGGGGGQQTTWDPDALTSWQKDNRMLNEMGKNIWKNPNPAYDATTMNTRSTSASDYVYDPSEIEPVDKTHCRRRVAFTAYVEVQARANAIAKASRDPPG